MLSLISVPKIETAFGFKIQTGRTGSVKSSHFSAFLKTKWQFGPLFKYPTIRKNFTI